MRGRIRTVVAVLLATATLVHFGPALLSRIGPRPPIDVSEANCARVKVRMTQAEVEQILGGPAGVHLTDPAGQLEFVPIKVPACSSYRPHEHFRYYQTGQWQTDDGSLSVLYGGGTVSAMMRHSTRSPRSGSRRVYDYLDNDFRRDAIRFIIRIVGP